MMSIRRLAGFSRISRFRLSDSASSRKQRRYTGNTCKHISTPQGLL
jgi:hypothetical protein